MKCTINIEGRTFNIKFTVGYEQMTDHKITQPSSRIEHHLLLAEEADAENCLSELIDLLSHREDMDILSYESSKPTFKFSVGNVCEV